MSCRVAESMAAVTTVIVAALIMPSIAAAPPADTRNFVACPILRDTQTVPCWLAEYAGELYYLGVQPPVGSHWRPPMLGHRVLVEGVVTDAYRVCGGIVLRPVVTSVLPELDPVCNTHVLPATEQYTVPFAGVSVDARAETAGAEPARSHVLEFEFDSARLFGENGSVVERILRSAKSSKAEIEIAGGRGATLLSDGSVLVEAPGIAARRIGALIDLFESQGIGRDRIKAQASDTPPAPDGSEDHHSRRVSVELLPVSPK